MPEKKYFLIIPADSDEENAKKEQYKIYQKDGETVQVAIGVKQEVPEWVAKLAVKVGDVSDFIEA
jgi:hypothetical protein